MNYSELLPEKISISEKEYAYLRIKKTNLPPAKGGEQGLRWTVRYLRKMSKKDNKLAPWGYKEVIVHRGVNLENTCEALYKKLLKRNYIK